MRESLTHSLEHSIARNLLLTQCILSKTFHVKVAYSSIFQSHPASFIQQARFSALPSSLRSTLTASLTGTAPPRVHLECGTEEGDGRGLRRPPPIGAAAMGSQLTRGAAQQLPPGHLSGARCVRGRRVFTNSEYKLMLSEYFKLILFIFKMLL